MQSNLYFNFRLVLLVVIVSVLFYVHVRPQVIVIISYVLITIFVIHNNFIGANIT